MKTAIIIQTMTVYRIEQVHGVELPYLIVQAFVVEMQLMMHAIYVKVMTVHVPIVMAL